MTLEEAKKIFKVWSQWYWPSHFILHSIFLSKIPESFLPYSQNILEEALNIIAKHHHNSGDYQASKNIQRSIASLVAYTKDSDALKQITENLTNPEIKEIIQTRILNFKNDWEKWIDK